MTEKKRLQQEHPTGRPMKGKERPAAKAATKAWHSKSGHQPKATMSKKRGK